MPVVINLLEMAHSITILKNFMTFEITHKRSKNLPLPQKKNIHKGLLGTFSGYKLEITLSLTTSQIFVIS